MSNDATKKWAEEQRKQEEARKRESAPKCMRCGAPAIDGSEFCAACD
jgi:hypothetical protein